MKPWARIAAKAVNQTAALTIKHLPTFHKQQQQLIRTFTASMVQGEPFKPAQRVAGQRQDVWSIVNEAAQASNVSPMVNMGQGFFGYNPPKFCIDAAKEALDRVECNQYSPSTLR